MDEGHVRLLDSKQWEIGCKIQCRQADKRCMREYHQPSSHPQTNPTIVPHDTQQWPIQTAKRLASGAPGRSTRWSPTTYDPPSPLQHDLTRCPLRGRAYREVVRTSLWGHDWPAYCYHQCACTAICSKQKIRVTDQAAFGSPIFSLGPVASVRRCPVAERIQRVTPRGCGR